jgi:2-polyprenyl-6-hydroxyphenyl methylase/3-demethylubiquinone-9 3-methyltransferase
MNESTDLLKQDSHFAFGKNWASYADLVTEAQINEAVVGLRRLTGGDLNGRTFLDIGCGSGLHSLAALKLGAVKVVSFDIDADSVATTRRVLEHHAAGGPWQVSVVSVFDLDPAVLGRYDVVYSWGVLHHTGDMYKALRSASAMVASGGEFIFALYKLTRLCWLWKVEKRWYSKASERAQRFARSVYVTLFRLRQGPAKFHAYVTTYKKYRGMDFNHDVHDWMGGWPYESISAEQVEKFMRTLGMKQKRAFLTPKKKPLGVFGSGCDEYIYGRP